MTRADDRSRSCRRGWWRRLGPIAYAGLLLTCGLAGAASGWIATLGPAPRGDALAVSAEVVDRQGRLLRAYATPEGRWRLPTTSASVDRRYLDMLLAYEDKRFRTHHGVDPLAMLRAALDSARAGRVVSGGSTLTMQVARLIERRKARDVQAKLREAARATQLERILSKDQILDRYLVLAPYGGNLEGVRAASLAYFGKEPRRLTLGEAALLVALPQSPEARRPDRHPRAAERARARVLDRMVAAGLVLPEDATRAKAEPMPSARRPMPMLAPHAADDAIAAKPEGTVRRLTLDAGLQQTLEALALHRVRRLGPEISAAIVVIDLASGEVRARVGSPDCFDRRRAGQVDLSRAIRSPGSTLKPFIYGLGYEDGLIHPDTLIEDRRVRFGAYAPENFDLTFQGTVTTRRALQLSLNAPAVAILDQVRASRLKARLAEAGGPLVFPRGEAPGLALGLGGVGVRLSDLTMLYAGLARGGTTLPAIERRVETDAPPQPRRLLEPVAAWYVASALLGSPPPENAAGGTIAFKTGTSYGFRDAWAVGFDGKRAIGVWLGRPDGAPVPGLTGRSVAAPLLFDAFARSGEAPVPLAAAPPGVVPGPTAKLPPPLRRFRSERDTALASSGLRILFPPPGAEIDLGPAGADPPEPIALKVAGGVAPLTVLANGLALPPSRPGRPVFYVPDGPGFVRLTVVDATGAAESVLVRVQ